MRLGDYLELLAVDVAFWLSGIKSPDYPMESLGNVSIEVSEKLRTVAIIQLLVQAESDLFRHNLIRSGVVWEEYLIRCRADQRVDDHHCVSGRLEPFFDPVAGGDLALASRIGALLPGEWQRGREYEDDYCYAQILHRWVRVTPPEEEIPAVLDRFEAYLESRPSARLAVCRALAVRDQRAFDEAFDALLEERGAQIEADKVRGQLEEAPIVAQRQVFIEGLAVLRIAQARGLVTRADYVFCPSLARVPMRMPFPGE